MVDELGFETVCKLFPLLEPEPYEDDVRKHAVHDQLSHGRRARSMRGYEERTPSGRGQRTRGRGQRTRGSGESAVDQAQRESEENVDYIMGRTTRAPDWTGPSDPLYVPARSLGDRVQSARRKIAAWRQSRDRRSMERMTSAELETLGAKNRERARRKREKLGLPPFVAKSFDPVYEILQRIFVDVVEPSLWVELVEDPRSLVDLTGPLGDLVDDMLNAVAPLGSVVKFAPGLRPVLKHAMHDQKTHGSWAKGSEETDSINFSGSENYGLVEISYGDMDFTRETMYGLNDVAEGGLNVWGTWEGNYQMRTVSAQMMGIERPPTEGSEYVGDARRKFLEKGDSSSLNAQSREDVQDVIFQTYAVMDSVSQSAPTELPLYRGMAVPSGSPVLGIKSGDEFTVPLSAFSYDESVARIFSEGPPSHEGGKPDERMVLKLAPGAKGAAASSDYWDTQIEVNNEFVAVPNEVVSQGTFKVNKVSKTDGITFVEIEHVKYVDVGSGSFVSV